MLVNVFTDGSCLNNPGPGGAAAVIEYPDGNTRELGRGYALTTNNRMELRAVIMALENIEASCAIKLYTDSQYVKNGITSWLKTWKANGFKNSRGKPVKNQDLWLRLDSLCAQRCTEWNWVRGHSGHRQNERCDEIARQAAQGDQKIADQGFDPHNL